SINGKVIREEFELAMIESSVDCSINKHQFKVDDLNCHLCMPNDDVLYTNDIFHDIKFNTCKPLTEMHINVKKISLDGKDYYYTKDGMVIKIYEFNDTIGSYVEMKKNNIYVELSKKILGI